METRTPLDDVEYLASSANRVEVLEAFAAEAYTRSEVRELTGVSQPTLGRILAGFEDRGWVGKSGNRYRITRLGELLANDFGRLLDTVETIQRLADLGVSLPADGFDFDLRLVREATITMSNPPDAHAHIRRMYELVQDATRVRSLVGNYYLDSLPKQRELVLERDQAQEVILSSDAFDGLVSHPEAVEVARELLGTDNFTLYRYEGEIPVALGIADEVAMVIPYDSQHAPSALIETDDETVREWVTETMDDYRARSERVTADDLPG